MKSLFFVKSLSLSFMVLFSTQSRADLFNNKKLVKEVNREIYEHLNRWFPDIFPYSFDSEIKPVETIKVSNLCIGEDKYIKYRVVLFLRERLAGSDSLIGLPKTAEEWVKKEDGEHGVMARLDVEVLKQFELGDNIEENMNLILRKFLSELSDKEDSVVLTRVVKSWASEWSRAFDQNQSRKKSDQDRKRKEILKQ